MYDDLIALAEQLATMDRGKPKQAHLRRAVSTAYYALFHLLVEESCRVQMGSASSQKAYRHSLGRAFVHTVMKDACRSYAGGTLPSTIAKGLPQSSKMYAVPKPIQLIASRFVDLQESRHAADYDLRERFKRSDVLKLIDETRADVDAFRKTGESDDRKFFLLCLIAWKDLAKRQ